MKALIDKIKLGVGGNLAKGSMYVFAGSMIGNIGTYLYHLLVGRILGPLGYGELSSLISLLYIIGVPTQVLQTVLVKYFSVCKARNEPGEAHSLYDKTLKIILLCLLGTGIVFIVGSPYVASYLKLSQWYLVVLVFFIICISTISFINISVLQGFQLFIWVGLFTAVSVIVKLVISVPMAYYGVSWTLVASIIAGIISFVLSFIPIRFIFTYQKKPLTVTKREAITYSIPTFLTLLCVTSLYSTDIILVKHFFSSHDAGIYSAVAVLGKIIFYASSAVTLVVFPMLTEKTAKKEKITSMVYMALAIVIISSLIITMFYYTVPSFITHLLFGAAYDGVIPYLGAFGLFMIAYSVVNLMSFICLAVGYMSVWIFTVMATVAQIFLIYAFHNSLSTVISINTGISIVLSIVLFTFFIMKNLNAKEK